MKTSCGPRKLVAKTCKHCGELKDAKHYPRQGSGYYTSHCNACKNKLGKPLTRKQQERSRRAAERHYQPWTQGELDKLAEMVSEGLTGPETARALNRSVYAINTMRNKLKRGLV